MKHYTYIIYSQSKDKFYIGNTADIFLRVEKHNAGATPSTKPGRPWILVYSEEFDNKSAAIKRELYIKRMKSKIYIRSLIDKYSVG